MTTFAMLPTPAIALRRELDRMFDDVFVSRPAAGWQPAASAFEDGQGFTISLDLPGLAPESIEVQAEDGVLQVKGMRPSPTREEGARQLFDETSHGRFSRTFRLPKSADLQQVSATASHGVLTLHIPKVAPAQPRRIEVTTPA